MRTTTGLQKLKESGDLKGPALGFVGAFPSKTTFETTKQLQLNTSVFPPIYPKGRTYMLFLQEA